MSLSEKMVIHVSSLVVRSAIGSFLSLLAALVVLRGDYDSETTSLALLVVEEYVCNNDSECDRGQIGQGFSTSSWAVVQTKELSRALVSAYGDSSTDELASENLSAAVGLAVPAFDAEGGLLLTLLMSKSASCYENCQGLAESSDQLIQLWLLSSVFGNWMVQRVGALSHLLHKMDLPSAAATVPGGGACRLGLCGEEPIKSFDMATTSKLENLSSPIFISSIHNANQCIAGFLFSNNSSSTSDDHVPPLKDFASDVERLNLLLLRAIASLNISTTGNKTNTSTKEKRREQFFHLMKEQDTTMDTVGSLISLIMSFVWDSVPHGLLLCVISVMISSLSKRLTSKMQEISSQTEAIVTECNKTNESLSGLSMATKSHFDTTDERLNVMQSQIRSLSVEKINMQERMRSLLNEQVRLRESIDSLQQERDEALRRVLVHQNEVKMLDAYVEKLLLVVLDRSPDLLQRQQ